MRIVAPIPKNPASKAKFAKKKERKNNCTAILHPLSAKVIKSDTTSFQYFSPRIPKSKKFGHWTSRSGGKKMFKRSGQMKKSVKKNFFGRDNFTPFSCKSYKYETNSFHSIPFPKDSENLEI